MIATVWDEPTTMAASVIWLSAPNDRNGNPRRLFLVVNEHGTVKAFDEGFDGYMALPDIYQSAFMDCPFPQIPISGKTYRELLRRYQ